MEIDADKENESVCASPGNRLRDLFFPQVFDVASEAPEAAGPEAWEESKESKELKDGKDSKGDRADKESKELPDSEAGS